MNEKRFGASGSSFPGIGSLFQAIGSFRLVTVKQLGLIADGQSEEFWHWGLSEAVELIQAFGESIVHELHLDHFSKQFGSSSHEQ